MALGDFFSDEIRMEFAQRSLEPGSVLRAHFPETHPPKVKLFVVLGTSKDKVLLGVVLINSQINPHIFSNPKVRSWHIPIRASDHDFLERDSWVDCKQIFEKRASELTDSIFESPEIMIGKLSGPTIAILLHAIREATTIAPFHKWKFGLA